MKQLVLIKCRNLPAHENEGGAETSYIFIAIVDNDWFEYPPTEVIMSLIETFYEEHPKGIVLITHGECHYCKMQREDAKEGE